MEVNKTAQCDILNCKNKAVNYVQEIFLCAEHYNGVLSAEKLSLNIKDILVLKKKSNNELVEDLQAFAYITDNIQEKAVMVMLDGTIFNEAACEIELLQNLADELAQALTTLSNSGDFKWRKDEQANAAKNALQKWEEFKKNERES